MKPAAFNSTPEFQHFKNVMRKVLVVPKEELDELVRISKDESPRNGNPHAPGRKPKKLSERRSSLKSNPHLK